MSDTEPSAKEQSLWGSYMALCRKIQSAIGFSKSLRSPEGPDATVYDRLVHPKHLRVGIDLRSVENRALVNLLVAKGVCTRVEWAEHLVAASEAEVAHWEEKYREAGIPASFG